MVMAVGLIHCWLANDYWTAARIEHEIDQSCASPVAVAQAVSLAAASMLTDAYDGSSARAEAVAVSRWGRDAGRQARQIAARDWGRTPAD